MKKDLLTQIVKTFPGEGLLLYLLDDLLGHLPELPQWGHALPHPLVNHLQTEESSIRRESKEISVVRKLNSSFTAAWKSYQ